MASIEVMIAEQAKGSEPLLDAIAEISDTEVAFYLLRASFDTWPLACTIQRVLTEASLRAAHIYNTAREGTFRHLICGVLQRDVFHEL